MRDVVDAGELQVRLQALHEQIKGRKRDYVNQRTKARYRERARGVELALAELEKLRTSCSCVDDGPHIIWNTECPIHGELATEFARWAAANE